MLLLVRLVPLVVVYQNLGIRQKLNVIRKNVANILVAESKKNFIALKQFHELCELIIPFHRYSAQPTEKEDRERSSSRYSRNRSSSIDRTEKYRERKHDSYKDKSRERSPYIRNGHRSSSRDRNKEKTDRERDRHRDERVREKRYSQERHRHHSPKYDYDHKEHKHRSRSKSDREKKYINDYDQEKRSKDDYSHEKAHRRSYSPERHRFVRFSLEILSVSV